MYRLKKESLEQVIGRTGEVLWESKLEPHGNRHTVYGYTPGYQRVATDVENTVNLTNTITQTRITGISECGEMLVGEIVTGR